MSKEPRERKSSRTKGGAASAGRNSPIMSVVSWMLWLMAASVSSAWLAITLDRLAAV